jgi:hypothetical protein
MTLTPEQKQAIATWVGAGDGLSTVQKKLYDQFKVSMTYRDVRFLLDDLNLELKDAAPKVDASDITKAQTAKPAAPAPVGKPGTPAEKKGVADQAGEAAGEDEAEIVDEENLDDLPVGESNVTVNVDNVTLIPGALASGSVTFSDGVTGKWVVDQYGRPGFTEVSKPGYRPSPGDAQAFMQELSMALQKRGF